MEHAAGGDHGKAAVLELNELAAGKGLSEQFGQSSHICSEFETHTGTYYQPAVTCAAPALAVAHALHSCARSALYTPCTHKFIRCTTSRGNILDKSFCGS